LLTLKTNETEARERLNAFWYGKSLGRPALLVNAKNQEYTPTKWIGKNMPQKEKDFNPEWQAWRCLNDLNSTKYLAESIPSVSVDFGSWLVMLALLVGADYEYDDSAWIVPQDNALDIVAGKFDPSCEIIKKLESCYLKVIETIGNKAAICSPVMLDAITTLSMIHTPDKLCFSLIEEPEKVKKLTNDMTTLYMDCYEHFYRFLGEKGYTDSATWLKIISNGRTEAVQCDFGVMLSPEMFEEFAMPDLRRLTSYFENSIYHLDGIEQMRFIEQIASLPKLTAIQWNPADWNWKPDEHMQYFKRIREMGLSLFIMCKNVDYAVYITEQLGSDGLMLRLPYFESEAEAVATIARIEKIK